MREPIPYGRQEITQDDIDAVVDVLKSDFLTQGPRIPEFEDKFSDFVHADYAVAVANGTAALHLSTLVLGLSPGDKVLTTPITFAATSNAVLYSGAQVEFVDIDPADWLIDLNQVEDKLSKDHQKRIKGIIPVDFAGLPVNMQDVRRLADKYGVWILEDSCHAPGAYFTDSFGRRSFSGSGDYADLAIFSFHPVKHIATGEGGMITSSNADLMDKVSMLRTHGITKDPKNMIHQDQPAWYHEMHHLGFNYRLSDIQAALGISQLSLGAQRLQRRNEIAMKYISELDRLPIQFQKVGAGKFHAYHLMTALTDSRNELYNYLRSQKIFCQVHYIPVYHHPYYRENGYKDTYLPEAENYYERCISLPLYPSMTDDNLYYVISSIQSFFNEKGY